VDDGLTDHQHQEDDLVRWPILNWSGNGFVGMGLPASTIRPGLRAPSSGGGSMSELEGEADDEPGDECLEGGADPGDRGARGGGGEDDDGRDPLVRLCECCLQ